MFYKKGYRETLLQVIEKTQAKTRVYVFIGENVALLALMSLLGDLQEAGRFDLKEYVILAVDNSMDDDLDSVTECHQFIAAPWSRVLYQTKSGSDWQDLHQSPFISFCITNRSRHHGFPDEKASRFCTPTQKDYSRFLGFSLHSSPP